MFFILFLGTLQAQSLTLNRIDTLSQKVSDKSIPLKKRLELNNLIFQSAETDSLRDFALNKYVYLYYKLKDSLNFQKSSNAYLKFLRKFNNKKSVAKTLEYKAAFFNKYYNIDSTFYYYNKSFKVYEKINDSLSAGKILMNTAILQKNVRDYTGSENTSLKALEFLKSTKNKRRISSIYNNLGIIYTYLNDYNTALDFHQKSLKLRSTIYGKNIYEIQSLNNIGKAYIDMENNSLAIKYLSKAFENDSLLNLHPSSKATIIDNLAYARMKKNENYDVLEDLNIALRIRDSIGNKYGSTISLLHLAEYHKYANNHSNAIYYTEKAEKLAKRIARNQEYLDALELIVQLYDGISSKKKFEEYIFVRDSLDRISQSQKRVFASIEFELQDKEKHISNQEKNNEIKSSWIIILIILLIISTLLFVAYSRKRHRQKTHLSKQLSLKNNQLEENKLQFKATRSFGLEKFEQDYLNELQKTLKIKYKLSKQNLEFWNVFVKDLSQKEQAECLEISKNTLVKRRKSLKEKIQVKRPFTGAFTSKLAKRIYQDEEILFKNTYRKK